MDSEELLYTECLPTLNSLPYFKFNEFVPQITQLLKRRASKFRPIDSKVHPLKK